MGGASVGGGRSSSLRIASATSLRGLVDGDRAREPVLGELAEAAVVGDEQAAAGRGRLERDQRVGLEIAQQHHQPDLSEKLAHGGRVARR